MDALRERVDEVARSNQAFPQISAQLDSLTQQMVGVLQSEIQRSGATARQEERRETQERES